MNVAITMSLPQPPRSSAAGSIQQVANAAYLLMGMVFAGVIAGVAIDHAAGTSPTWTVILGLAGLVVGFVAALVIVFRKAPSDNSKKDQQ
jgi:F0F1-type ATP synthase assembly protein I